jgi:hypothetical protein
MSNLLLRKMALKSIIGFGNYPLLSVQELINMEKHSVLIQMYYRLGKIDFTDEVKGILKITKDREITKPGKDYMKYYQNICKMIDEIYEENKAKSKENLHQYIGIRNMEKKTKVYQGWVQENRGNSKMINKNRNQGVNKRK